MSGWRGTDAIYEARIEGHGFNRKGQIRSDTAEHVIADADMLASLAACCARAAQAHKAETPPCPVCEAIAGWAPTCSACRVKAAGGHATYDPARTTVTLPPEVMRADAPAGLNTGEVRKAPEGYRFRRDHEGDIEVWRDDGAFMFEDYDVSIYFCEGSDPKRKTDNACPKVWAGHEAARQWAAHLLGETAPPLRGTEPTITVGQRVQATAVPNAGLRRLLGRTATVRANTGPSLILEFDNGESWGWDPAAVRPA